MAAKKAFPLRLDPRLYEAIRRLADAELRSVNAEIEYLLRESLRHRGIELRDDRDGVKGRRRNRPPD